MLGERFSELCSMFPEPMLLVATDGLVLAANPAARRVIATPGHAIEGRSLLERTLDAPERVLAYLRSCARSRQMLPGAITLRRGDEASAVRHRVHGALFQVRSEANENGVLLRLEATADSPSRFGLLTEKIDALRAEVARRRAAEEALREREERLRVVLTSIGDAVIVTDRTGAVTFMNPVAQSLTGWPQEAGYRRPLEEVFIIADETTGEPVESPVRKVLQTGSIVGLASPAVLRTRDGRSTPIDDSAAPIRRVTGELEGVVLVFREIAERKQAERERERLLVREQSARLAAESARGEAEAANRAKDEFLAMLGHELRNPLAPILTALDLMRLQPRPSDEPTRLVLERQVGHMVRLVDDLLDVSRIARGRVEIDKQRMELAVAVTKAIEMASPMLEQSEQHLTVDVPARGLVIDGDVTRLAQVVSNLLANASKYTPRGGLITLTATAEGGEVVLKVIDTGIGITAQMLPRVFEMFAQEGQTLDRAQGGLGLGLAIVRNLVTAHGGTVHAHSAGVGHGSAFTIRVPAAPVEASSATDRPPPPTTTPTPRSRPILVVDDNDDAGTMLARYLRKLGHSVRVAHDGPSALDAIEDFTPEVAFLDLGLPVMDGYELARRLRAREGLEHLYLVAVTGYGQDADRRRSEAAGFDVHLVKPVGRDVLSDVLSQVKGP